MTVCIYFIQAGEGGPIKIGLTRRGPKLRMVKMQSDCPHPLKMLLAIKGEPADEGKFHQQLRVHLIAGEWFAPHADVLAVIEHAARTFELWPPPKRRGPKYDHPLCQYRARMNITLAELAEKVGITHASLSRIESGKQSPSLDLTRRLRDQTGLLPALLRPDLASLFAEAAE